MEMLGLGQERTAAGENGQGEGRFICNEERMFCIL